ncbi:hypothetical protein QKT49_gp339 [Acanthamoeba castellanii medusavirus]|uniref:Uncharacterized protein n=1 Tax=Acanthamoeba castellanii medusavirus J1 TaxID=3114988 RepID=A0A3T1CX77_9VIRU|nr:hypothetical protein QKT49_gp339 [Acanthamoeba castellanii medusavirus]BBI30424.1 hypothetical protein [Acanthamoeba castellanii medusavirus J1]
MKRTHETEIQTKNKRRAWPGDMVEMFKDLYAEALRKAEKKIACHPSIFNDRYVGQIVRYHELLGDGAAGDVGDVTRPLIERNRELNAAVGREWWTRYKALYADSSVPYYFVSPSGFNNRPGLKTPVGQLFLLSHITDRPELIPELQAWLDHRTEAHYRDLTDRQRLALSHYTFSGYSDVWRAFDLDEIESSETAKEIALVFKSVQSTLPLGVCLFEGQGYHPEEDDLLKLRLTEEQLPYSMTSRRPRSTSILPNVGIHYASMGMVYPDIKPKVARWRQHPKALEDLGQWALHNGYAKASGCLIRYYVRGPVSAIPIWASSYVKEEAEVLLPPGCKLTVFKIERAVELAGLRVDDPSYKSTPLRYDVYHVNLEQ